jgi:hypothetical protein
VKTLDNLDLPEADNPLPPTVAAFFRHVFWCMTIFRDCSPSDKQCILDALKLGGWGLSQMAHMLNTIYMPLMRQSGEIAKYLLGHADIYASQHLNVYKGQRASMRYWQT